MGVQKLSKIVRHHGSMDDFMEQNKADSSDAEVVLWLALSNINGGGREVHSQGLPVLSFV